MTALAGTSNVVVTEDLRASIGSLPAGTLLVDLGPHVVRDFLEPVRLFRLQGIERGSSVSRFS